ncbi:MAG: TonB-dependent receptor, partial [Armatimonadota bacterium]
MRVVTRIFARTSTCIKVFWQTALLGLIFLAPLCTYAQDAEPSQDEVSEEAPVTITAPRIRMEEKSLAGTVTVITRSDIERTGAQNLMDLIIREPGIFVARKGQLGYKGDVRVRGLGGDPPTELLVTINGHPNFMGIMGHILPAAYLLDNVERIEILRGPASALFGTMGMGGVINIVTRKPTEARQLSAKVDYGTYATKQAETSVSGTSGRWGYLVGWSSRITDGNHPYAWFTSDGYSLVVQNTLSKSLSATLTAGATVFSNLDQSEVQNKINAGQTPVGLEQNFDRRDYDLTFDWTRDGASVAMLKLYGAHGDHNFQDGYHSKD